MLQLVPRPRHAHAGPRNGERTPLRKQWNKRNAYEIALFRGVGVGVCHLASNHVLANLASTDRSTNRGRSKGLPMSLMTCCSASSADSSGPSSISCTVTRGQERGQ